MDDVTFLETLWAVPAHEPTAQSTAGHAAAQPTPPEPTAAYAPPVAGPQRPMDGVQRQGDVLVIPVRVLSSAARARVHDLAGVGAGPGRCGAGPGGLRRPPPRASALPGRVGRPVVGAGRRRRRGDRCDGRRPDRAGRRGGASGPHRPPRPADDRARPVRAAPSTHPHPHPDRARHTHRAGRSGRSPPPTGTGREPGPVALAHGLGLTPCQARWTLADLDQPLANRLASDRVRPRPRLLTDRRLVLKGRDW